MRTRVFLMALTVALSVLAVTPSSEARRWRGSRGWAGGGAGWYGGGGGWYGGGQYGGPGWAGGWGYSAPGAGWGPGYGGYSGGYADPCCDTGIPVGAVVQPGPATWAAPAPGFMGGDAVCCY